MAQEKIGSVTLDLSHYSGSDLYCDGEAEDRILSIVQKYPEEEFDRIIRREKNWPVLYHLSSIRGNIVSWIPFTGREKVLEIGAGPGAITGILTRRCAQVDCVELSKKRSLINAYRHRDAAGLTIHVGNFEDIEPTLERDYDYVFLIGVLEYAKSYLSGRDPFHEELTRVLAHLRPEGRAVIAIENRLGLKYWAGCAEDHSGRYYDGIESYSRGDEPAETFTRPALEKLIRGCGAKEYSFYYPYPDYKFTEVIYSDRRLPHASELSDNIRNFDRERLLLFDEQKAYRGITEDGLYPVFANSYEVVIGPGFPAAYCKFSNDRAPQYRIRTEIDFPLETCPAGEDAPGSAGTSGREAQTAAPQGGSMQAQGIMMSAQGVSMPPKGVAAQGSSTQGVAAHGSWMSAQPEVRKYPMTAQAAAHVAHMEESGRLLAKRYQGRKSFGSGRAEFKLSDYKPVLHIASCRSLGDGGVAFPFVPGRSLESLLDESLERGDGERFLQLLETYRERVGAGAEDADPPISDYDMTFANILISGDTWTAVDYEWAVDENLAPDEMLFRALLVYYLEDASRSRRCEELIGQEELLNRLGIPEEKANRLAREEKNFQDQVTGGVTPLGELRAQMGTSVIKPPQLQTEEEKKEALRGRRTLTSVQVYYDTGSGYHEEDSVWLEENYREEGLITFDVAVPADTERLRVDPALCPCMALLREAWIEETEGHEGAADGARETAGPRADGIPADGRGAWGVGADDPRDGAVEVTDKALRWMKTNGRQDPNGSVLYTDGDPWMEWKVKNLRRLVGLGRDESFVMGLTIQMVGLPSTMAEALRD